MLQMQFLHLAGELRSAVASDGDGVFGPLNIAEDAAFLTGLPLDDDGGSS